MSQSILTATGNEIILIVPISVINGVPIGLGMKTGIRVGIEIGSIVYSSITSGLKFVIVKVIFYFTPYMLPLSIFFNLNSQLMGLR